MSAWVHRLRENVGLPVLANWPPFSPNVQILGEGGWGCCGTIDLVMILQSGVYNVRKWGMVYLYFHANNKEKKKTILYY